MRLHDLLAEPFLGTRSNSGETEFHTLPSLMMAFQADRIEAMTGLRPHQRHAFHAFVSQVAAMSAHRVGGIPTSEEGWRAAFALLADGHPTAWSLVAPFDAPALLQPVTEMASMKPLASSTPDAIDMLVTAKNHKIKAARMATASPETWFYALVTLQTMEGFLGAGNFGISRMNGGFSNRPGLGIKPPGGIGAHVMRDVAVLLTARDHLIDSHGFATNGVALLWTLPWNGDASIPHSKLDPYFVEVCRRVRLTDDGNGISALLGNSTGTRVSGPPNGKMGDPWTPLVPEKDDHKALTVDARGFSYQALSRILFDPQGKIVPALCMKVHDTDASTGLSIVARAMVRGQGKTEGYHERVIPVSRMLRRYLHGETDVPSRIANERVQDASNLAWKVLRPALTSLLQNGPDKLDLDDRSTTARVGSIMETFDDLVDRDFFDSLNEELEARATSVDAAYELRKAWQMSLVEGARQILNDANARRAGSKILDYRAIANANSILEGGARKNFPDLFAAKETAE